MEHLQLWYIPQTLIPLEMSIIHFIPFVSSNFASILTRHSNSACLCGEEKSVKLNIHRHLLLLPGIQKIRS